MKEIFLSLSHKTEGNEMIIRILKLRLAACVICTKTFERITEKKNRKFLLFENIL